MTSIIFDLDGTIVFSHPTHFAAYEKVFTPFGIKWTIEEFEKFFVGTGAPAIIEHIMGRNGVKNFDTALLTEKKRDFFNELLKTQKLKTVPGFFKFIGAINKRGLKKAIASAANKSNILNMLKNIGAYGEFSEVISGEDVKNPKPAPDIFLEAARRLNAGPADCLVIEDTVHGIIAAKAAGMKCAALATTLPQEELKKASADWIFSDYTEIPATILS